MRASDPELVFGFEFDDRAAWEIEQKGWLEGATVRLPDGRRISVCFYDPVRLSQELEAEVGRGKAYFAEPGLLVLSKLTRELMESAVRELYVRGYFGHLAVAVLDHP
jgi:hypothetical protein